ncbi:YecA family protein [Roseibium sp. TrichSKD4]|uniref:hypothetical protein n=1 Tax=Roseibium sp. TrichSKD4 TaxID=744980 RepID=UPI0001E5733B|nr:hypothetical protein [Roseibium sp. TrichSKD4]EFO29147.1 YecA family protein [Roseibium sp. TrichSKD4]
MFDDANGPKLIYSKYGGPIEEDGITVEVRIYRLETSNEWTLEVVDDTGTSTVWEGTFSSDREAFIEFKLTVEEEGMVTFLNDPLDSEVAPVVRH